MAKYTNNCEFFQKISICNTSKLTALIILFFQFSTSYSYASGGTKIVQFDTDPQNAQICEVTRGKLLCIGNSPHKESIEFRSNITVKKYWIRKIGYFPKMLLVRYKDDVISTKLKKRDIISLSKVPDKFKSLAENVKKATSEYIYSNNGKIFSLPIEITGAIDLILKEGKPFLSLGIILDDNFRSTKLRAIRRERNQEKKNVKLVDAIMDYTVQDLLSDLYNKFSSLSGLYGIALSVNYTKSGGMLVEDFERYSQHIILNESYSPNYIYEKHIFRTIDTPVTKVKDTEEMYTMLLTVPFSNIPGDNNNSAGWNNMLKKSILFSNNNRKKEFKRINY